MNVTNNDNSRENDWLIKIDKIKKDKDSIHIETEILESVFELIKDDNWCVEFGANDGISGSNTRNFIINKGWSGILIEADKKKALKLIENYRNIKRVVCLKKFVTFSGPNTLDNILSETQIPKSFGLLSIDIDGNDYHIWDSFKSYYPKVVIIEFNQTFPVNIEFIQPKDMRIKQGSSYRSIVKLGNQKGYELIAVTEVNAIFVRKEYFNLFKIKDNSPYMMYNDDKYHTYLYQLYDGTLLVGGNKKLIWHGKQIRTKEIQVVHPFFRRFPGDYSYFQKQWIRLNKYILRILKKSKIGKRLIKLY